MSNPLSPAEAKELIRLYETGRLYDVEAWIAIGVKERISVLRARLQAATALAKGDHDGYESAGREIFGRLRETWERAVPELLLNDVVERYRPSIDTKKIAPLHDITEVDCKAIDRSAQPELPSHRR